MVNPCLNSVSMSTTVDPPANLMAIPYTDTTDALEVTNFENVIDRLNKDTCEVTCELRN